LGSLQSFRVFFFFFCFFCFGVMGQSKCLIINKNNNLNLGDTPLSNE
jgi:hypothetical protein